MSRIARASARVNAPTELPGGSRTELAGDGRVRLRILPGAHPIGPPEGALSYRATWHAGRWSGEASIIVVPVASWSHDLEISLEAPASRQGKLLWPEHRLRVMAEGLVLALRDEAERTSPAPEPQRVRRPAASGLRFRSPGTASR